MVSGVGPELNAIVGSEITDEEIVLSQWLADDLAAKPGDKVTLVYNVVGTGRALEEQRRTFKAMAW